MCSFKCWSSCTLLSLFHVHGRYTRCMHCSPCLILEFVAATRQRWLCCWFVDVFMCSPGVLLLIVGIGWAWYINQPFCLAMNFDLLYWISLRISSLACVCYLIITNTLYPTIFCWIQCFWLARLLQINTVFFFAECVREFFYIALMFTICLLYCIFVVSMADNKKHGGDQLGVRKIPNASERARNRASHFPGYMII
jgi:hypothetical protein